MNRFTQTFIVLVFLQLSFYQADAQFVQARQWSSYFGGEADVDMGNSVVIDTMGNVYMAGQTASTTGIASAGSYKASFGGGTSDGYLSKFSPQGQLLWATYFGGNGNDATYGLVLDADGNIYMAGETSSATGLDATGGFQATIGGQSDAFLAKFSPSGQRIWATYYGGSEVDQARGVTVDSQGNVYITGITKSPTGIATGAGHSITLIGTGYDAFLAKFNSSGQRLWGTYYGGSGNDQAFCVAVDAASNVYIGGLAESTTGISTAGSHQATFAGGNATAGSPVDGFLAAFSADGERLWGTYYGGTDNEVVRGLAVDAFGVYIGGNTRSTSGISSGASYQPTLGRADFTDGFLAKFNASGIRQWGTYYGGTDSDYITGVFADGEGKIYVGGAALSSTGIATIGSYQLESTFTCDGFMSKFSPDGALLYGSYYGGNAIDIITSIVVDPQKRVFVAGETRSTSGMASAGCHQAVSGGQYDSFLAQFGPAPEITAVPEPVYRSVGMWPNPIKSGQSLHLPADRGLKARTYSLTDALGRQIALPTAFGNGGMELQVPAGTPPGIYHLNTGATVVVE